MITDRLTERQTGRQTDAHHGNSATIRSMNASRAKMCKNVKNTIALINPLKGRGVRWLQFAIQV